VRNGESAGKLVGAGCLNTSRVQSVVVFLVALIMAWGHAPIIRSIFFSFELGAYFLFATVVYVLCGILLLARRLFKLANVGLILMAIVDNLLLVYTRTMPNIFFRRVVPWTWEWNPLGTVQIFVGQLIIIVLCALLLYKSKA
jgi:hypothetical protein